VAMPLIAKEPIST